MITLKSDYETISYQILGDHGDCANFSIALNKILKKELYGIFLLKDHDRIDAVDLNEQDWTLTHVIVYDQENDIFYDINGAHSGRNYQMFLEHSFYGEIFEIWKTNISEIKRNNIKVSYFRILLYYLLLNHK